MTSIQQYAVGSKMRRAALQILVQQLDAKETRALRRLFLSIDKDSAGWINARDFSKACEQMKNPNQRWFAHQQTKQQSGMISALCGHGDQRIYYSDFLAA